MMTFLRAALAAVALAFASAAFADTTTISLSTSAWTDLGAGPMQVVASGGIAYQVAASQPSCCTSTGIGLSNGERNTVQTTSHVWGLALFGAASAVVTPIATNSVADTQSAAFQGAVPMTVGTTYTAGRSIKVNATAAGSLTCTLPDASTTVLGFQANITPPWTQTLPFACTQVSSVTGTATFESLK